jgi:hypothetical protein
MTSSIRVVLKKPTKPELIKPYHYRRAGVKLITFESCRFFRSTKPRGVLLKRDPHVDLECPQRTHLSFTEAIVYVKLLKNPFVEDAIYTNEKCTFFHNAGVVEMFSSTTVYLHVATIS